MRLPAKRIEKAPTPSHPPACTHLQSPSPPPLPTTIAGLMSVWRAFYASYLDVFNNRSVDGSRRLDRYRDAENFIDAARSAVLLALAGCVVLQVLGGAVGEERVEEVVERMVEGFQHALQLSF
jgi:hypothetical protein